MKESQVFLNYFRKNAVLIIIPTIFAFSAFYYYQLRQPFLNFKSKLYILDYNQDNIEKVQLLTDNFVLIIRDTHLKKQMGITEQSKVIAYKTGPLTIDVTLANLDENQAQKDSESLENYITNQYPINRMGHEVTYAKKTPEWILAMIGLGIGFILGNTLSLIKIYLSKY